MLLQKVFYAIIKKINKFSIIFVVAPTINPLCTSYIVNEVYTTYFL